MKMSVDVKLNVKAKAVEAKVEKATEKALKDVVTDIAGDVIKESPVATGNNRRSIMFEVGPHGAVAKEKLEGAVYSTSGYGGYLEVGTVRMPARSYFRPALDRHISKLSPAIKAKLGT